MTTRIGGRDGVAAIDDRAERTDFIHQELIPFVGTIIVTIEDIALVAVLEILDQRTHCHSLLCTAGGTVSHIHRDADIGHQLGHGVTGLGAAAGIIGVEHQVPTIDRLTVVSTKLGDGHVVHIAGVGMASPADIGPLVVVHDLGGGCRHTTSHGTCRVTVVVIVIRAVVVIGFTLVPHGCHERCHGIHTRCRPVDLGFGMGLKKSDLTAHLVHPIAHGGRHVVCREIHAIT